MRVHSLLASLAVIGMITATPVAADSPTGGPVYLAGELLSPCQESDNDARWGEAAETECEQYLVGFVEALLLTGAAGAGTATCPPDVNTADEVRWAFMRWVHGSFSKRKTLPAAEAVMETLKENFPCS